VAIDYKIRRSGQSNHLRFCSKHQILFYRLGSDCNLCYIPCSLRYVAIVHPLKPQLRRTHARWMILPVWVISLILVSPYMASLELKDDECVEDFESAGMDPKYYTIGVFITQYVVPLGIIAFSYIRYALHMQIRSISSNLIVSSR
jgi:hypothetical protein